MRFHAEGTFVIDSWDDNPDGGSTPPPGTENTEFTSAAFTRTYSGDFTGSGRCQSTTARSGPGHPGRIGIEIFEGTIQGRTGQCSIIHRSLYGDQEPWQPWTLVSGEGGLAGIQGEGRIVMTDDEKSYSFEYDFEAPQAAPDPPAPKKPRKRFWAP